jgi:hypothetical protein
MKDERPGPEKEPYQKPEVQRITLVAEEMAVAGCKTPSSHTGPYTGCVGAGACPMPGS